MTDLADGAPRQVGTRRRAWRAYSMRCRVHRLARIEACPGIAPDFQWFPASDHTTSVLGRHEYRLDKEALIEAVAMQQQSLVTKALPGLRSEEVIVVGARRRLSSRWAVRSTLRPALADSLLPFFSSALVRRSAMSAVIGMSQ